MLKIKKGQTPRILQEYSCQLPRTPDKYLDETNPNVNVSYDEFCDKDIIKEALLSEQGHVCAYCMQRIDKDSMKIEHWFPQSKANTLKKIVKRIKQNNQSWSEVTQDELLKISSLNFGIVNQLNDKVVQDLWKLLIPTVLDYSNMLGCCEGNEGVEKTQQHCDTFKGNKELKYNPANKEHHIFLGISYVKDGTILSSDEEFNIQLDNVIKLNNDKLKNNRKSIIDTIQNSLSHIKGTAKEQDLDEILKKFTEKNNKGQLPEYSGVASFWIERRRKKLRN